MMSMIGAEHVAHVRDRHTGHSGEALRVRQRSAPYDGRAPVAADQDRLAAAELVRHGLQVADNGRHVVGLDRVRLARCRHHSRARLIAAAVEAGRRQCGAI